MLLWNIIWGADSKVDLKNIHFMPSDIYIIALSTWNVYDINHSYDLAISMEQVLVRILLYLYIQIVNKKLYLSRNEQEPLGVKLIT